MMFRTSLAPPFSRADETRLIALLRRVQEAKAVSLSRTQRLFARFRTQLEREIAREEESLFPPFDESNGLAGSGPTAIMRVEHRQLRHLLEEIGERFRRGDLETDAEQIVLIELLRRHRQQERALLRQVPATPFTPPTP